MGGLAELDLTLFSQGMLVGWAKRFIHPRKAPWKLVVEHWLSPLITVYTNIDVRWLLVSTVPSKLIVDTVPCSLWKQMGLGEQTHHANSWLLPIVTCNCTSCA